MRCVTPAPPDGVDVETHNTMAFTMTAELLLLQHTCHWFCKTRTISSMRLIARQKTPYEQVLRSVAPGAAGGLPAPAGERLSAAGPLRPHTAGQGL